MNFIDSIVGLFSPRAAAERLYYRDVIDSYKHSYDAGDSSRLNSSWHAVNASAENLNTASRDIIRARARDLERNSDIENALISAYKRNIIGKGYRLQAKTGTELDEKIEELWCDWCKKIHCDATESQSFTALMRMALVRKIVDGGILIKKCYDGKTSDSWKIPFRLQLIDVDELDVTATSPKHKGNTVVSGVEINPDGKAVGYYIRKYSKDGYQLEKSTYCDAKDMIYYMTKTRPSQVREMSQLTPTLTRIRDVNEFITAVSVKERIAACLSIFVKKSPPTAGIGRGNTEVAKKIDYTSKKLSPGMITEMNAGDSIEVVDPKNGGDQAASVLKLEQKLISSGQGISYEAMSRDMSDVNYSSARQANIEDELTFAEEAEALAEVMDEIYETFVISAWLAGEIQAPDFWTNKRRFLKHIWVAPAKKWIDPQKEANANKTALDTMQTSLKQIAAERGMDWKTLIDDVAEVKEYAMSKGITAENNTDASESISETEE